jgi:hypothetical protein
MNAENNASYLLNSLSAEINKLYGFVEVAGDNFGEPAINSGPCGPFAYAFYTLWNQRFPEKVNIVFIMVKSSDECWHVLIRLPTGRLFDGGHGVHSDEKWDKFDIEDMIPYNYELLEKRSYGLNRVYPRYCPTFSIHTIEKMIKKYLNLIEENISFQKIKPSYPKLDIVINSSIGAPTLQKITQILQEYEKSDQFLIGAFSSQDLIGVIGFELISTNIIIKHISVLDDFRKQGLGQQLINYIITLYPKASFLAETDNDSVGFYKKMGFNCRAIEGKYGIRYKCSYS